ncbi:unnamed protein product [Tuber melanosporum]|uniref:(Perigord truffle) hypothetical protein n=1 Tax=Tuber melanosporum (strain Mel28) TaxID=656061 RepID=D5G871_TUBMM|nr:uncharacterized protein GSTUM_00002913001 [Tuber melanosporum]CAZ80714.1 unnamed protein product [Tuber melanosporum]
MSKITVAGVRGNVKELLEYSTNEKKRNFLETVELQIGLKNYDPMLAPGSPAKHVYLYPWRPARHRSRQAPQL